MRSLIPRLLTTVRIIHSTTSGEMSFLTTYIAFGSTLTTFTKMVPSTFLAGVVNGTASLVGLLACIFGLLKVPFSLVAIFCPALETGYLVELGSGYHCFWFHLAHFTFSCFCTFDSSSP